MSEDRRKYHYLTFTNEPEKAQEIVNIYLEEDYYIKSLSDRVDDDGSITLSYHMVKLKGK